MRKMPNNLKKLKNVLNIIDVRLETQIKNRRNNFTIATEATTSVININMFSKGAIRPL